MRNERNSDNKQKISSLRIRGVAICHPRDQALYYDKLKTQMSSLKREIEIEWLEIVPGDNIDQRMEENLARADLILPILSPDLLRYDEEHKDYNDYVEFAMDEKRKRPVKVVPILARTCEWESSPCANLQMLPKDPEKKEVVPISKWTSPDDAYREISSQLKTLIKAPEPKLVANGPLIFSSKPRMRRPIIFASIITIICIFCLIAGASFLGFLPWSSMFLAKPTPEIKKTLVSSPTASSPTPMPTALSPTPMPTALSPTPMPTFVPTPTQKAQVQPTPLPVVNVHSFQSFVRKQQVVLSDFSSRNWNSGSQTSGTCSINNQNQTMQATSAGPAFSCQYNSSFIPAYFALKTQIIVTKGSQAGLTFNIQSDGQTQSYDLYKADIISGNWSFNTGVVNVGQNNNATGSGSGILAGSQMNVLGIVIYKQTLYLYVNDVLKYTHSGYGDGKGTIGMYIGAHSQATYTQITVWQLATNLNIEN